MKDKGMCRNLEAAGDARSRAIDSHNPDLSDIFKLPDLLKPESQVADPFLPMKRHSTLRVPYPFAFCAKNLP
jgi:hypothetical protein